MAVITGKTEDGQPLVGIIEKVTYRQFADRSSFPWLLEISVDIENPGDNGLPSTDERLS